MCPVGHVTHLESQTPHGWAQVIAAEKRGLIEWTPPTVGVLFNCADCGVCQSHCVTDQPLPDAIVAARASLVERGTAPAHLEELKERFETWQNLYEEKKPEKATGKGDVALFAGDAAAYLWPEALQGALELLRAVDIDPVSIGAGRNNGHLASSLGLHATARALARDTLDELEATGASKLVVLAPGDYYAFAGLYPDRLDLSLPENVEVVDLAVLLDDRHQKGDIEFKRVAAGLPYAYVDPTHTVRALDRVEAPRRLLGAVLPTPALELFWRKERAHPAGDGALHFTNPALSDQLTIARHEDAMQAGAQGIVTEDPATLYHLHHQSSSRLPVKGMYELLADHLA